MRTCAHCKEIKSQDCFYFKNKEKTLLASHCKKCNTIKCKKYRLKNKEAVRVYERNRKDNSVRRELLERQNNNPEFIARRRVRQLEYYSRNKEKSATHRKVAMALKSGKLKQLSCEVCGDIKSEAHHCDYSKPLSVNWLCRKHHAEWHRINGKVNV